MADDQSQRRLRRQLWGVPPTAADQMLTDQADRFAQEVQQFKDAIAQLAAEEKSLAQECQALGEQLQEAQAKWSRLRKGLERQRSMATLQALVLAREMADMDREHARHLAELQEQREALVVEIELQRESLNRWVRSLLQSVAERDQTPDDPQREADL